MMNEGEAFQLLKITEAAAAAAADWVGRGNPRLADKAAVDAMRAAFDRYGVVGTIKAGEGEKDRAPQLYLGERVGGEGLNPGYDIVVDPVEGTELAARGLPGSVSALAAGEVGAYFKLPDIYMEKLVVGPKAAGRVDLEALPEENLRAIAGSEGKEIKDLNIIVVNRPRHERLIRRIREAGARITLIQDGDVMGSIQAVREGTEIDALMGTGGSTEGILTATAIRCLGGEIQARFRPISDSDYALTRKLGISLERVYKTAELARGKEMFCILTAVTDGKLLKGVHYREGRLWISSLVMFAGSGIVRRIETDYPAEKLKNNILSDR